MSAMSAAISSGVMACASAFCARWRLQPAQSVLAAVRASRAVGVRAAPFCPRPSRGRSRPGATAHEESEPGAQRRSACPCSVACFLAVSTLIATSPAIFSGPAAGFVEGNESTSVASSLPRKRRFRSRIVASVVSSTVTSPSKPTAACASLRYGPACALKGCEDSSVDPDSGLLHMGGCQR